MDRGQDMTGNMGGSGMRRGVMVVIGVVAVVVSLVAGCAAGVGIAYVMGNRDGHALVADSAADGAGTSSDTGADAGGRDDAAAGDSASGDVDFESGRDDDGDAVDGDDSRQSASQADDSDHCAAWVGMYYTLGDARNYVDLKSGCGGSGLMSRGMWPKLTYDPGSFVDEGNGRYSWTVTSKMTYDPQQTDPEDQAYCDGQPTTSRSFEVIPTDQSPTGVILHDTTPGIDQTSAQSYYAPDGYTGGMPQ